MLLSKRHNANIKMLKVKAQAWEKSYLIERSKRGILSDKIYYRAKALLDIKRVTMLKSSIPKKDLTILTSYITSNVASK